MDSTATLSVTSGQHSSTSFSDTSRYDGLAIDELLQLFPLPPGLRDASSVPELASSTCSLPLVPPADRRRASSTGTVSNGRKSGQEGAGLEGETSEETLVSLILRLSKDHLSDRDRLTLSDALLALKPSSLEALHERAHNHLLQKAQSSSKAMFKSKPTQCEVSRHTVSFSNDCIDGLIPINDLVTDTVVLSNPGKNLVKFELRRLVPNSSSAEYELTVDPETDVLKAAEKGNMFTKGKPGGAVSNVVTFKLKCLSPCQVACVYHMVVENGLDHFFVVSAKTEKALFGLPLTAPEMQMELDWGYTVPAVLKRLRLLLEKGIKDEGIFRETGDGRVVRLIRKRVCYNEPIEAADGVAVATVLKQFFRSLPQPLLQRVPLEAIQKVKGKSDAILAFNQNVQGPERGVALWFLTVLLSVSDNGVHNKTTHKKLAVVTTPSLYQPPVHLGPKESLEATQQAIQFVEYLLEARRDGSVAM